MAVALGAPARCGTRDDDWLPAGASLRARGRADALTHSHHAKVSHERALAAHGLTERSLQVYSMDSATAIAALVTHQIDAAFGGFDRLTLVVQETARIAYTSKGDDPAISRRSHLLVTKEFATARADIVERVVGARARSANRDRLFEVWSQSGCPAAVFKPDFDGQTLTVRNRPLLDDIAIAHYRAKAAQVRDYKLLTGPGIGGLIVEARDRFEMDLAILGVLLLGLIGFGLNRIAE